MTPNDLIRNSDFLLTESEIDKRVSIDEAIIHLLKRRTSGTLSVDFHEGGVRTVRLSERRRMSEACRDSVRKILKME